MRGTIRRPVRILTLVLWGSGLVASPAAAFTTLDAAFGTPFDAETPRTAAMGSVGASLYQGAGSLVANPAMLSWMTDRVLLDVNGGFLQATEDRFAPLYDTFNSYVAETTVASNRNHYGLAQGGALLRPSADRPMIVGVGIFDRYSFDYDYAEEIRDPEGRTSVVPDGVRDQVIQVRDYRIQGRLRSITAGYGMSLPYRLSLGLSIHRYFGTLEHRARTETMPNYQGILQNDPGSASFDHELGGWGWSVGVAGTATERIDLGASFEGPFTVEGALTSPDSMVGSWIPYDQSQVILSTVGTDVQVKYPGTLRVGATLRPRNVLSTIFSFELVRRFWESVDQDSYRAAAFTPTGELRDTWDLRLGLEHVFYNRVPARFGFRYLENYADRESARSIFSAGTGAEFAGYGVDVGLQYHRQTTRQAYLFDRSLDLAGRQQTYPAPAGLSKVEDSMVSLLVGVSRRF
jgi:hypothetical protein